VPKSIKNWFRVDKVFTAIIKGDGFRAQSARVMCVYKPTENELFLANYGVFVVVPMAMLLTAGNCYCCIQLCYKGGFLLPCKNCCRACCRKYVAGVRTGSFNRMFVGEISDDEAEAAIECAMVTARLIAHLMCTDNI